MWGWRDTGRQPETWIRDQLNSLTGLSPQGNTKSIFADVKPSVIWQVVDESADIADSIQSFASAQKLFANLQVLIQIFKHKHSHRHTGGVGWFSPYPSSERKAVDHRLDMNVFPLIVPCCFAMWQEAEPSLVTRWVVAAVQTVPCAHSALNGPWNQSLLATIMPLNIQHGLPACAGDYQGIVSSILVLNLEEYFVSLCWNTNTHTQMPGASSKSSAVSIPSVLILQKLILKHLKKKQM